ncbi:hypothetical protein HanRHA438_Chr06g0255911 [Helianthus annuus]|nr:hypothetical protein HanRHA438_Chr06g0255911 [Helianthus annuus]
MWATIEDMKAELFRSCLGPGFMVYWKAVFVLSMLAWTKAGAGIHSHDLGSLLKAQVGSIMQAQVVQF